jgi:replicative DNA helicase
MMAHEAGRRNLYLDSLKDMAGGIAADEEGAALNRAVQMCVADGIEVTGGHHQRKNTTATATRPKDVDSIYGSSHITNGAGSILLLWGEPGDLVLTFSQLKAPSGQLIPFDVTLDLEAGDLTITDSIDLADIAGRSSTGLTVEGAARALGYENPEHKHKERARRELEKLVKRGELHKVTNKLPNGADGPTHYKTGERP